LLVFAAGAAKGVRIGTEYRLGLGKALVRRTCVACTVPRRPWAADFGVPAGRVLDPTTHFDPPDGVVEASTPATGPEPLLHPMSRIEPATEETTDEANGGKRLGMHCNVGTARSHLK
jgi:hypothetical protein